VSTIVILSDHQLDALAERVADRLALHGLPESSHRGYEDHSLPLLTVKELAARLGCSADLIYRRSRELGGVRIGGGPRAPLRFDPDVALTRWTAIPEPPPSPAPRRHRRRPPAHVSLLPIRGESPQERTR
jgi:AraC-like DNA-binding protein